MTQTKPLGIRVFTLVFASCLIIAMNSAAAAENVGHFEGDPIFRWDNGPRTMTLLAPFAYIDPKGFRWGVPANTVVDGASIPQSLWSIVGGPFEGPYRQASIVHDHYCVVRTSSWQDVHKMFYYAMLAGGTGLKKAKMMYYAVYVGGPRWENVIYKNHPPRAFPKPGDKEEVKIESWQIDFNQAQAEQDIQSIDENSTIENIEALATRSFKGVRPPAEVRTDLQ